MTTIPQYLTGIELERALACIEKGQHLAGHFPDAEDLAAATRILTGQVTPEEAEIELAEALARVVEKEQAQLRGS
ncbi:hypothetical protein SAMN06298212_12330 [Ruaniaceae bacterium KH17]|nr:hypothetical protein SAMN06298212_12330 [Ruaniaceae bacterium KH17]